MSRKLSSKRAKINIHAITDLVVSEGSVLQGNLLGPLLFIVYIKYIRTVF